MKKNEVIKISNEYADIWLTYENKENIDYCYGGTRSVSFKASDEEAEKVLNYLGSYESGVKNLLINQAITEGVFKKLDGSLPNGFSNSQVGGGRCVFRPKTESIEDIIMNPNGDMFEEVISSILKSIGNELNKLNGILKLTPDFGRFAGVADILHRYTENVLGICCEDGGCGGKASYTSTGINAAIDYFFTMKDENASIVLIGSNGACGDGVLKYILEKNITCWV